MALRRPRRLHSFSYIGRYSYFVTFCTKDRRKVFETDERVDCVLEEILRTCSEQQFAIPAGVFMPDHVHLLVRGLDERSEFKRCMKIARQRSAHAFRRVFGEHLWQEGFFDHIVCDADDERQVIDYIVSNPERAGLCATISAYPHAWWPGRPIDLPDVRRPELSSASRSASSFSRDNP